MSEVCDQCGVVHEDEDELEASWNYWAEYTKDNTLHSIALGALLDPSASKRLAKIFSVTATLRFEMEEEMRQVVVEALKAKEMEGPVVKICFLLDGLPMTTMCVAANQIDDDEWAKDLSKIGTHNFIDFVLNHPGYRGKILSLRVLN